MKKHPLHVATTLAFGLVCLAQVCFVQGCKSNGQTTANTNGNRNAQSNSNAPGGGATHHPMKPIMIAPGDVKWGTNPELPGVQVAVLDGDPSKEGSLFAVLFKEADGTKFPPHWHLQDEHIIVLQGAFIVGLGEKFDLSIAREMPTGSFLNMPKDCRHFAQFKGETTLLVYSVGPFKIFYVNPEDNPVKGKGD